MTVLIKASILKLMESNLRNVNQIRCFARWSHRHPRRVLSPEEYDKIEEKRRGNANIKVEKNSQSVKEKIIELDAKTDLPEKQSKVNQNQSNSTRKWTPKSIEVDVGLINMDEVDGKSDTIHYRIASNVTKKKKATYKTKNDVNSRTTDMLETVIDANGDFIYTKLKDNDPVVGQLLLMVKSRNEQIKKDLALLEGKRLIKDALEAKCNLKNLIFSRKADIEYLKPYLPKSGAKLYKMPYKEIQMWSDLTTTPGIMGIFKTPEVEKFVTKISLPLTVICDNIREPGNLGAILRTAVGVGAQSIILTKGCVDLWDTKVLRSACGAHFRLQIYKKMDWSDIRNYLNEKRSTICVADNRIVTESIAPEEKTSLSSLNEKEKVRSLGDIILSMPLLPYYGVDFGSVSSVVLIAGGETEGISEQSYRLAADFDGIRLNIPLSNGVDSLNTGTALGIIMFEIKKQMALLKHKNEVNILMQ